MVSRPGVWSETVQTPDLQVGVMGGQVESSRQVNVSTIFGTQTPSELQTGAKAGQVESSLQRIPGRCDSGSISVETVLEVELIDSLSVSLETVVEVELID